MIAGWRKLHPTSAYDATLREAEVPHYGLCWSRITVREDHAVKWDHIGTLIADDHSVVRWALRAFLHEYGVVTVLEAASLADMLSLAATHKPEVVLVNTTMISGAVESVTPLLDCGCRMLAYGAGDADLFRGSMPTRGLSFVARSAPFSEFAKAVEDAVTCRQLMNSGSAARRHATADQGCDPIMLSGQEREVAALIARGLSSSQIASRLFVSTNTVETHRYRIFRKLGIHSRSELVEYAIKTGLVKL